MRNCHQMAAFGGGVMIDTNYPCYQICFTKNYN